MKKNVEIYIEQRKCLHGIYMMLINYSCAKHQKLKNKIQEEIEILDEVIRISTKHSIPKQRDKKEESIPLKRGKTSSSKIKRTATAEALRKKTYKHSNTKREDKK